MSGARRRGVPILTVPRPSIELPPRFMEGLVAGALIGAAIAGSTLWARLRRARAEAQNRPPLPSARNT